MRKFLLAAAFLLLAASAADGQCLLTFQTESLAPFFVDTPGHFQLEAVSGTEPYTFTVHSSTPLPDEFHLTPKGKLIGKPSVEMDQVIIITVTDAAGCQLNQAFNLVVFPEGGPV